MLTSGWSEVLKIAAVAVGASLLLALTVGFYETSAAAKRAFPPLLLLCLLVGSLQVVRTSVVPYVLAGFGLLGLLWVRWQRSGK